MQLIASVAEVIDDADIGYPELFKAFDDSDLIIHHSKPAIVVIERDLDSIRSGQFHECINAIRFLLDSQFLRGLRQVFASELH